MRNMTTTYVYLISDCDGDLLEVWGSKKRAVQRCYKLAKRGFDPDFPPAMEGDVGSVSRVNDPYRVFTWVKMTVKR